MPENPARQTERQTKEIELAASGKREEIFSLIESQANRLKRADYAKLVLEHSVEDGLLLADRLGLNEDELYAAVTSPGFIVKHHRLFEQLVKKVSASKARQEIETNPKHKEMSDRLASLHNHSVTAAKTGDWDMFETGISDISNLRGDDEFADRIDDYYAPLLKTRKFSPRIITSEYPAGERSKDRELASIEQLADEALLQTEILLWPAYYVKPVEEILNKYASDHNLPPPAKGIQLPTSDGIFTDLESIKQECEVLGLPFEGIEPKLNGAKYVSLTAGLKRSEAERGLLKKLNRSLTGRGQKIELKAGNYEAVEDKAGENNTDEEIKGGSAEQKEFNFPKFEAKVLDYINQLLSKGADKNFVARGLAGLDSDRAWQLREHLLNEGVGKNFVAMSLAGLDSDRAWQMREHLLSEGADKSHVARGLAGLGSDRAWQLREQLLSEGVSRSYIALGLAGLDSDRAWQMREQLLSGDANKGSVALGLAGLDSDRAWQLREQLLNEGVDKGSVAMGLAGDYLSFVWQLKLKKKESQPTELSEKELEQLQLLNLLHTPTAEGITSYFRSSKGGQGIDTEHKQGLRNFWGGSTVVAGILSKAISQEPKPFLETIAAKRDRLPEMFAERLAVRIFPEIKKLSEKSAWRGFAGYGGLAGGREASKPIEAQDYLNPGDSRELAGGGAEGLNDNREIMEFREALGGIVALGIYGRYNPDSRRWEKADFPVNAPLAEPTIETTATVPNIKNLSQISLPKPLEARVIPERAKGFGADGKEYALKVEIDNLGQAKVIDKPKAVEKIVYSLAVSAAPAPMENLSPKDYNLFKQRLLAASGGNLAESLAGLPEDLELELLEAIQGKTPKEQVVAIERLVRDLGYYDGDNQEVSQLKAGKSLEEQVYIMEQRLEELRQRRPEQAEELAGKRFAGVCSDFAQLTAILLRHAGFAAGVISGFSAQEKKIRVKQAHAAAFVIWPDEGGRNRIISIDGTPGGLAEISLPSLAEKEAEAAGKEKELSAETMKKIQEIIASLNKLDVETVRKMSNGELERVINGILKYQVKESHLAIIERLFDYYWYTPIHTLDLANPGQRGEAILELSGAVGRQRHRLKQQPEKDETPAGSKLMQVMEDFLGRFAVAGATEDPGVAFGLMENILELVQNDLNEIEQKSAFAVLAYLKAKNILGEKK